MTVVVTRAWAVPADWDGPVWVTADGAPYAVSSGPGEPEGWTPDSEESPPTTPGVVSGVDGVTALRLMGLAPRQESV